MHKHAIFLADPDPETQTSQDGQVSKLDLTRRISLRDIERSVNQARSNHCVPFYRVYASMYSTVVSSVNPNLLLDYLALTQSENYLGSAMILPVCQFARDLEYILDLVVSRNTFDGLISSTLLFSHILMSNI